MGMPEQPKSRMNIAPDGTVYEILDDGTIKRIGKVSPDGSFEPFGGTKDGIREKNGIIYRVINGKEVKIGRILPNGEIETINQRIRSEAEVSRNKVKIVTIISILIEFLALLYFIDAQQERKVDTRTQAEAERIAKAEALVKAEQAKAEQAKAEAKKAEEDRKKKEAEAKKAEAERKRTKTEPLTELSEEDERALERIIERNIPHLQKKEAEANKTVEVSKANEQIKYPRKIGDFYWSSRSRNEMNWQAAIKYCENLSEGGFTDWRLPNIYELEALIDGKDRRVGEFIDGGKSIFGDTDLFWSSSTTILPGGKEDAGLVDFEGGVGAYHDKSYNLHVRCVRAAQ